jgi:hypothetical protein
MRRQNDFSETEQKVELKVSTYCPEKWLLIDQETGQIFRGNQKGFWDKLESVVREEK